MTKKCLWCPAVFEIQRKRVALCPGCRVRKHRLQVSIRDRERAEERATLLNNVLPLLPVVLHSLAYQLADEYLDKRSDEGLPGQLRMAPGTKTAAGADEGRTTEYVDLQNELDEFSRQAAEHPWWDDHPPEDVFFELGNDDMFQKWPMANIA